MLTPPQILLQLLIPQLIPRPIPQLIPGMDTMAMVYVDMVDTDGVVGEVTTDHIGEELPDTGDVRKDPQILLQILTPLQILQLVLMLTMDIGVMVVVLDMVVGDMGVLTGEAIMVDTGVKIPRYSPKRRL